MQKKCTNIKHDEINIMNISNDKTFSSLLNNKYEYIKVFSKV